MRYLITLITLLLLINTAFADVYSWEDKDGMHFVDDPSKVPAKYLNKTHERTEYKSIPSLSPRIINGRVDVSDLHRQAEYYFNGAVHKHCSKFKEDDHTYKKCTTGIAKITMEYYQTTVRRYRDFISASDYSWALNWSL